MSAQITSAQLRAARAMIKWDQNTLATAADISIPTVKRLEGGEGPLRGTYENISRIITALETAGVIFIDENGEGPGVRLKK